MGERWQLDEFYTHLTTSKMMQPNSQSVTHIEDANSQSHFNLFGLQSWHIVVLVLLAACAIKPELLWVIIPVGFAIYLTWSVSEKQRIAREAAARVGACANISGVQIVDAKTPYESPAEIQKRCDQWREDLRASGNIYAELIPIIPYPFNPMIYGVGELTYAWDKYRRMVGEVQHQENIKWVEGKCPKELRGAVLSQIIGQAAQPENQN